MKRSDNISQSVFQPAYLLTAPVLHVRVLEDNLYGFYLKEDVVIAEQPVIIHTGLTTHLKPNDLLVIDNQNSAWDAFNLFVSDTPDIIDDNYVKMHRDITIRLCFNDKVNLMFNCILHAGQLIAYGKFLNYQQYQMQSIVDNFNAY